MMQSKLCLKLPDCPETVYNFLNELVQNDTIWHVHEEIIK